MHQQMKSHRKHGLLVLLLGLYLRVSWLPWPRSDSPEGSINKDRISILLSLDFGITKGNGGWRRAHDFCGSFQYSSLFQEATRRAFCRKSCVRNTIKARIPNSCPLTEISTGGLTDVAFVGPIRMKINSEWTMLYLLALGPLVIMKGRVVSLWIK